MVRHPAISFALCGGLLFAASRWLPGDAPGAGRNSRATVADSPNAGVEDVLYLAARARGLDRDDPVVQARLASDLRLLGATRDGDGFAPQLAAGDLVVRRRLIERMRLLIEAPAQAAEPTDGELQAFLDSHADRFALPARISLVQVFLSRQRPDVAADAQRLLARLDAADVSRAAQLSDPLPIAADISSASARDLARLFGDELATAALTLPPGQWQGPLRSPYGLHLVWVRERMPATLPSIASVRDELRADWREERAAAALRDSVGALLAEAGADATTEAR